MKQSLFAAAACAALLALSSPANAAPFSFQVVVNTAPLISLVPTHGPFALDFQLNGIGGNTLTIDTFNFGGGSPLGAATTFNGASGSLAGSVGLTDTIFFANEFFQSFTPGSILSFWVRSAGANVVAPTPDSFSFAILDGALFNIPTTGLGDSLLQLDIDSPFLSARDAVGAQGTGVYAAVSAQAVPEPASLLLFGSGLAGFSAWRRRRAS